MKLSTMNTLGNILPTRRLLLWTKQVISEINLNEKYQRGNEKGHQNISNVSILKFSTKHRWFPAHIDARQGCPKCSTPTHFKRPSALVSGCEVYARQSLDFTSVSERQRFPASEGDFHGVLVWWERITKAVAMECFCIKPFEKCLDYAITCTSR